MDDIYGINVAKTELREADNTGDVNRLLAVFGDAGFTDMSGSEPSKYGGEDPYTFTCQQQGRCAAKARGASRNQRVLATNTLNSVRGWKTTQASHRTRNFFIDSVSGLGSSAVDPFCIIGYRSASLSA